MVQTIKDIIKARGGEIKANTKEGDEFALFYPFRNYCLRRILKNEKEKYHHCVSFFPVIIPY